MVRMAAIAAANSELTLSPALRRPPTPLRSPLLSASLTGEHEYHREVVDEGCGGQLPDPVMSYHEGVGERDQYRPYLAYHYRAGKFCEPSSYSYVACFSHKAGQRYEISGTVGFCR